MSRSAAGVKQVAPIPIASWRLWNLEVPRDRVGAEVLAGFTTFLVMAYIIFVNPSTLGFLGVKGLEGKGLPFTSVLTSTCLVAALRTIVMGLCPNRSFPFAPG